MKEISVFLCLFAGKLSSIHLPIHVIICVLFGYFTRRTVSIGSYSNSAGRFSGTYISYSSLNLITFPCLDNTYGVNNF